ncbi:Translation initiation factor aIF-2, bacterial-like [Syntrophomonas zehnderi OL-4]|uniref:Translation initiation factor IF-2 n=1 Tax=Syntrophomonas zehnderi OL-4 TaxID=690567 RepID=A0A0E4C8S0_9FIRM|nr:translation initiation factor IF-2 [Syntrophomonas zehnderi]CFX67588.1 Translation initiation factor aIF-2, bacterial-like [Syntrophomonas zehnderi OL-4]
MAKIRVHELAKELGISSKNMVNTLQELGLDIKNHMSTMEDSQANWVRKRLRDSKTAENAKPTPASEPKAASSKPEMRFEPQPKPKTAPKEAKASRDVGVDRNVKPQPNQSKIQQQNRPQQPNKNQTASPSQDVRARRNDTTRETLSPDRSPQRDQSANLRPARAEKKPGATPKNQSQPVASRPQNRTAGQAQDNRPRPQNASRPQDNRTHAGTEADKRPNAVSGRKDYPSRDNLNGPDNKPAPQIKKGRSPGQKTAAANKNFGQNKGIPPKKDFSRPQRKGKHKRKKEDAVMLTPELIQVGESIQVRDLAEKMGKTPAEIVKKLMELGTMATINQEIDFDTVEIVASLFGVDVEREISEEEKILEEIIDTEETLQPRSPIVTVMGHVDHGKTSLLDRIRQADVASGEAGGITQHIGAYQVTVNGNRITFIDTPGHAAFTAMRARGANLTDLVILVVAADDGVMPQTVEAINHIKAADVPFVVALNKMDKNDVNPDKVMQQLTEYNIVPEEWGGDTMFIPVSAKTGLGIEDLLERVLLIAEIHDLRANPHRLAEGVVIEGELDKGRGAVATVLVQKGTLRTGDYLICGTNWCKVRTMTDYRGRRVEEAYPSMPVEITGWSDVPEAGEKVQACDEKIAKEITNLRLNEKKLEEQKKNSRISLDDFFKQMQDADVKELNLIIKGDVQGSVEALASSLLRLNALEVKVNVIHSAVGAVTETDVMLASASNAIIIGFNVRPDVKARRYAEEENIDVRLYRVIYEAIEDVKKAMEGLLDPEYKEKYLGRAEVRATFRVPNIGTIAGSYVIDGKMQRNAHMRVLRDGVIIYDGKLESLKRFKDDVKEVVSNFECGIGIQDFNDVKEGDIIEAYTMEEIKRTLD